MNRVKPPEDFDATRALLVGSMVLCYLIVFIGIMWLCLLLHPIAAVITGGIILFTTAGILLAMKEGFDW